MLYNYIIETENILLNGFRNGNSIFYKHAIPKLYKKNNGEMHRGLNQLRLAQLNLSEYTIPVPEIFDSEKKIHIFGNPVLICEKNKKTKKIDFNFYYNFHSDKPEKKYNTSKKAYYDLSEITDILEYYFSCSINSDPYVPNFEQKQKDMFLNYIIYHPYDFSKITNNIFSKLLKEIHYD